MSLIYKDKRERDLSNEGHLIEWNITCDTFIISTALYYTTTIYSSAFDLVPALVIKRPCPLRAVTDSTKYAVQPTNHIHLASLPRNRDWIQTRTLEQLLRMASLPATVNSLVPRLYPTGDCSLGMRLASRPTKGVRQDLPAGNASGESGRISQICTFQRSPKHFIEETAKTSH